MTIDRDEAFALLSASCPSFGAVGGFERYVSSFEEADQPDPYVRTGALAHHVVELVERRDLEEVTWVLGAVERVLAEGDGDAVELVLLGFLEPLRNIVSHDDVGVGAAEVATVLGPEAATAWSENEDLWEAAARWRCRPDLLGTGDYAAVSHPDLRRYLRAHRRRMADGALIGASDVVSYQQEVHGASPSGGVPGRVPWLVVVTVVAAVLVGLSMLAR